MELSEDDKYIIRHMFRFEKGYAHPYEIEHDLFGTNKTEYVNDRIKSVKSFYREMAIEFDQCNWPKNRLNSLQRILSSYHRKTINQFIIDFMWGMQ